MRVHRFSAIIITLLLVVAVGVGSAFGAGLIKINLNGENVEWKTPPVIQQGRIMVPLRLISEMFGADVSWDSKKQTVNIGYQEPFADDGPLASLMLVEEVTVNDDGTWQILEPGVCWFYTGYNYLVAVYTADNLKPGMHSFQIAVKNPVGKAVKSILNTYEVGPDGYFRMYEELPAYLAATGRYTVELTIDGQVVSKTVIVAENPPAA